MLLSSFAQGPKCNFKVVILRFRDRIEVVFFFFLEAWLPFTFRAGLGEYTLKSFVCALMKFEVPHSKNQMFLKFLPLSF